MSTGLINTFFKRVLVVLTFSLAVGGLIILSDTSSVDAQESGNLGNGLRINRLRQEFTLQPGQQEAYEIEVTNVSPSDLTIMAVINDFESDNETGQPKLLTRPGDSSPFSLESFVILPEPFRLASGESQNITIRLDVPEDLNPGGYFGAIRFAPTNIEGEEGSIALTASVGSLLLVTVPGDVLEGMDLRFIEARQRLETNETVKRAFYESPPDLVAIGLENTGNSILQPYGRVSIKNMFGNEVYSYEFNGEQPRGNVLPQSGRTFENDIENLGPIGRYTIEANLSYGDGGGNIINASGSFWIMPWRLILLAIAVIIFIIWFMTRGIKVYNKHVIERAKRG